MTNSINYLQKVEIYGLWGHYDLVWDLHPDVNVLAGINGSGKSTLLNYINWLLTTEQYLSSSTLKSGTVEKIKLFFKDGGKAELKTTGMSNKNLTVDLSGNTYINTNLVNTFDVELKPLEAVQKLSDNRVKTELDWEIHQLQIKYMDYQLNLSRKKDAIFKENQGNPFIDNVVIGLKELTYPQKRFLEIIDELFSETNKKINRDKNQLEFLLGDKEINAYQLSSGEKQLLIILLTVLVQDNKPSILLMDEPEISLHFEWQENLISCIRELNPNAQLIIATHSADLIMKGWGDRVFELSKLTVKDRLAS